MSTPFYHNYIEYFIPKKESSLKDYVGEFVFCYNRRAKLYISKKDLDILYVLLIANNEVFNGNYTFGDGQSYLKIGDEKRIVEILEELKNNLTKLK